MNDSLWGHKDMQLSLPTTKSLNHSRRRRQHEHRRLGEAVRWRGGEAVASSSLFVPNHFISGVCSVLGAYGCVRPRRRGGVQGAGKGWSASKQEWKMLPPPPKVVTKSRELCSARCTWRRPSCHQQTAFPALGGPYQANDNTGVQRLLMQNPVSQNCYFKKYIYILLFI